MQGIPVIQVRYISLSTEPKSTKEGACGESLGEGAHILIIKKFVGFIEIM